MAQRPTHRLAIHSRPSATSPDAPGTTPRTAESPARRHRLPTISPAPPDRQPEPRISRSSAHRTPPMRGRGAVRAPAPTRLRNPLKRPRLCKIRTPRPLRTPRTGGDLRRMRSARRRWRVSVRSAHYLSKIAAELAEMHRIHRYAAADSPGCGTSVHVAEPLPSIRAPRPPGEHAAQNADTARSVPPTRQATRRDNSQPPAQRGQRGQRGQHEQHGQHGRLLRNILGGCDANSRIGRSATKTDRRLRQQNQRASAVHDSPKDCRADHGG